MEIFERGDSAAATEDRPYRILMRDFDLWPGYNLRHCGRVHNEEGPCRRPSKATPHCALLRACLKAQSPMMIWFRFKWECGATRTIRDTSTRSCWLPVSATSLFRLWDFRIFMMLESLAHSGQS